MTDPGQPTANPPATPALQFDRVESTADTASGATATSVEGILCASCGAVMLDEYYSIGGKSICANCRTSVETTRATSRTPKAFGKALVFGLGAALAGAAVYYAVIALLDLEIGIVAILIGWMVGRAIQKALPGGGLRRYQLLAVVLTYFAVGMAYMAVGVQEMWKDAAAKKRDSATVVAQQGTQDSATVVAQQAKPAASPSATSQAGVDEPAEKKSGSILLAIGALIAFAFSLPVIAIFSGGSGILTALIIAIGLRQAWQMSGAPALKITGPFRVGGEATAAAAS
jgi:hypothetical protein